MISFNSHFWGEKHNGFDVLYHNMKAGLLCSRELEEYIKESCVVEETYMKLQNKLAKMATNYGNRGSFGPFWQLLRTLSENFSSSHQSILTVWQELMKDVHKYTIDLQKTHREVKEKEVTTVDTVQALQQTSVSLNKSKELFHGRSVELERLRKEGGSVKEMEKMEAKVKKANEDYKVLIDKHNHLRNDFITHMGASCQRFQQMEESQLGEMKRFLERYHTAKEVHCDTICKAQSAFKDSCTAYSVDKLISMLVETKATGSNPPAAAIFQEADFSAPMGVSASTSMLDISGENSKRNQIGGILSIPIKYRNPRLKKNKDNQKTDATTKSPYMVDEFGYSIKPEDSTPSKKDSFDSSSDGSDNEGTSSSGGRVSKLRVEIRPIQGIEECVGGGVDLKNVVQAIKLPDLPKGNNRKTPINELNSKKPHKPSHDLINLDLFATTTTQPSLPSTTITTTSIATTSGVVAATITATSTTTTSQNNTTQPTTTLRPTQTTSTTTVLSTITTTTTTQLDTSVDPINYHNNTTSLFNGSHTDGITSVIPVAKQSNQTSAFLTNRPLPPLPTEALKNTPPPLLPPPTNPPIIQPPKNNKASNTQQLPTIATPRPTGRNTPDSFKFFSNNRSESVLSLNSVFPSSPNSHHVTNLPSTTYSPPSHQPSRGPSPLPLSRNDSIPVAMAISECVNAFFHGSNSDKCQAKTTGNIVVSFPGGIVRNQQTPSLPPLSFTLHHTSRVEHLLLNKQLLKEDEPIDGVRSFSFIMPALIIYLKRQAQSNLTAVYFNVEVVKYQLRNTSLVGNGLPLRLASYWKSTSTQADFRLDYTYYPPSHQPQNPTEHPPQSASLPPQNPLSLDTCNKTSIDSNNHSDNSKTSSIFNSFDSNNYNSSTNYPSNQSNNQSINQPFNHPLTKLQVSLQLDCKDANVKMESAPFGEWLADTKRATWKLPDVTTNQEASVKAKFAVTSPTTMASNLCAVKFVVEGSTVSGMEVALKSTTYRLSLSKKRLFSGKYYSEAEIIKSTSVS